MDRRQILGIIGSVVLFLGVFMPIVSVPFLGGLNYFQNGRGDGTIVLGMAAASLVLVLLKKFQGLWITSAAALGMLAFTFVGFQLRISQLRNEMQRGLEGNPFASLGNLAMQSVQIQWGWALLILGALLVLGCAAWADDEREKAAVGKRLAAVGGFLVIAVVGTFAVGHSSPVPQKSVVATDVPKQHGGPTPTQQEPESWRSTEKTNEMDGSKLIVLYHAAETEVPGVIGTVRPSLFVRCKDKRTDVLVNVETQIESEYGEYDTARVRVRLDDGSPVRQRWSKSTSGDALFSPDPVAFAKRLAASKVLLFEYTPFRRGAQTIKFNLEGLSQELPKVAEACGWHL